LTQADLDLLLVVDPVFSDALCPSRVSPLQMCSIP